MLFAYCPSAKLEEINSTSLLTASSWSGPSAVMVIFVPRVIPSDNTPRRLLALTLRSSFYTQTVDLNSFAFCMKKVAGRACSPTWFCTTTSLLNIFTFAPFKLTHAFIIRFHEFKYYKHTKKTRQSQLLFKKIFIISYGNSHFCHKSRLFFVEFVISIILQKNLNFNPIFQIIFRPIRLNKRCNRDIMINYIQKQRGSRQCGKANGSF